MNTQLLRWCIDIAMGIVFLIAGVTGILKFMILVRVPGLSGIVLPMAIVSDIHDRAGIVLCCLVAVHLFLNRAWIRITTQKVLSGTLDSP